MKLLGMKLIERFSVAIWAEFPLFRYTIDPGANKLRGRSASDQQKLKYDHER